MIIKIDKNTLRIFIMVVIIALGVVITIIKNPGKEDVSEKETNTTTSKIGVSVLGDGVTNSENSDLKTATMGEVTVEVTPVVLGIEGEKNIFSVVLNTHSVELEFDFTQIIFLKDDIGNEYNALEWTGNSGWHHVSGDIIFPKIDDNAKNVTLSITEIENTTTSLEWKIK